MRQFCFLSILFYLTSFSYCQEEFSFELSFEDALGNKDTVVVGYDENATFGIDGSFGEQDISGTPWNTVFDVRVSERLSVQNGLAPSPPPNIHTKKQIIPKSCTIGLDFGITLNIVAENYPIIVRWNSNDFNPPADSCRLGSLFTTYDYYQDDVGSGFAFMADQDSMLLFEDPFYPDYDDNGIDVNLYWVSFAKKEPVANTMFENSKIKEFFVYPNPTTGIIKIDYEMNDTFNPKSYQILSIEGVEVFSGTINSSLIDLSRLDSGLYILIVKFNNQYIKRKIQILPL